MFELEFLKLTEVFKVTHFYISIQSFLASILNKYLLTLKPIINI